MLQLQVCKDESAARIIQKPWERLFHSRAMKSMPEAAPSQIQGASEFLKTERFLFGKVGRVGPREPCMVETLFMDVFPYPQAAPMRLAFVKTPAWQARHPTFTVISRHKS